MTHADIWLPLNLNQPNGSFLYCEAWSDGYLSSVGLSLLCSTHKLKQIIDLNTIFVGSPFFYNPSEDTFFAKEEDYLIEGYVDSDTLTEDLIESAERTLELINENKLEEAFKTEFSQLPLETKLLLEIGINAKVVTFEEALKEYQDTVKYMTENDIISKVINYLKSGGDFNKLQSATTYIWKDGQFQTGILFHNEEEWVNIPLITAIALISLYNKQEYLNVSMYLDNITPKDKKSLLLLKTLFIENNLSTDLIFQGNATTFINELES